MNRIFFVLLGVFSILGCAAGMPGLIVQSQPYNPAGRILLIRHFDFDPAIAAGVRAEAVRDFGECIALDLQRYLKEAGFRKTLVVAPGEAARGEVLIRGTILRVHGGNARQRKTLELFGFGASEVKAAGEVMNVATAAPLLAFSLTGSSHYTWLENEPAVRENLREIAREIAAAVAAMR